VAVFPLSYTGGFTHDNVEYFLREIHFHTPAEHTISMLGADGMYDMEMHMIHKANNNASAAVSVLWRKGPLPSQWLNNITSHLPNISVINQTVTVSLTGLTSIFQDLVARNRHGYWSYIGTQSTPPCTAGMEWVIMSEIWNFSVDQFLSIHEILGVNERPIQRTVANVRVFRPDGGAPAHGPSPEPAAVGVVVGVVVVLLVVLVGSVAYFYVRRRTNDDVGGLLQQYRTL